MWPSIDPEALTQIEMAYFRKMLPLGDAEGRGLRSLPVDLPQLHPVAGAPYLIEDERLPMFASLATAGIEKANDATKAGRWSGSPIPPRIRGFG